MKVGILALQGAVLPHQEKLQSLGVDCLQVRTAKELEQVDGIILPGGESTTMLKLIERNALWQPLQEFVATKPVLAVCAGAILLAQKVTNPPQESLAAIHLTAERNAYGRQLDSAIVELDCDSAWPWRRQEGVFIRAPKLTALGANVMTLMRYQNEPVLVEEANVLAGTFHPELSEGNNIHQYFLEKIKRS